MTDFVLAILTAPLVVMVLTVAGLVGVIGGRLPFLPPMLKPYQLLARVVGAGLLLVAAAGLGYRVADERCDAKALAAKVETLQRDLAIQKLVADFARKKTAELESEAGELQKKVGEYEDYRATRGVDVCRLTDDDIRRLHEIR